MEALVSQLLLPFSHCFLRDPALSSTFLSSVPGRRRHYICHRMPSVLDIPPGDVELRHWKVEADEECLHWKVTQSRIQSWHCDKTKAPAGWTLGEQRSPASAPKASLQRGSRGGGWCQGGSCAETRGDPAGEQNGKPRHGTSSFCSCMTEFISF